MRAHVIVNPTSGADRAVEMVPRIESRLRSLYDDVSTTVTGSADDVRNAAALAVEHASAVYVAGGDGTLNLVLRGMIERDPALPIPIGVIPLGTGNDFAKALGLGDEPDTALRALLNRQVISVDIGLMNDRPFVNASAGGFIAETSDAVTPALKDIAGKLAYLIGGAKALFTSVPLRTRLLAATNAGTDAGQLMPAGELTLQMFAVCNAPFIGGGAAIAPSAVIDDGLLDVIAVPEMSLLEFVATLQRLAASGEPGRADVRHFRSAAFDLVFDRIARVNVDGEVLETERCSYRVRSLGARFFCGSAPLASSTPARFGG
jgi:diacylglycerol kinase (ATP)